MDTVLYIGLVAGTVAFIVQGEVKIRRADRRFAQEFPAKIVHAQLEHKIARRASALRDHLKPEDLEFLARNGSDFARSQLKAIEAPQPEPEPFYSPASAFSVLHGRNSGRPVHSAAQASSIMGKHLKDRTQAERYYLRHGHWPWEDGRDAIITRTARTYPRKYT